MSKHVINPPGMPAPSGYSYAVKKPGTPVFIAGQVALDASGKLVGPGDPAAQAEQVMKNLKTVVEACGGTMADLVKTNVYVTDASYRSAVVEARKRWFTDGAPPASTYVVITALAVPELLIEIEAVAMIDR
ncbi:MAG TPA: RidA family protein [Candidatus Binatia bacterium]|nr:RidA family protein [Candidatus Binatia bacterium]